MNKIQKLVRIIHNFDDLESPKNLDDYTISLLERIDDESVKMEGLFEQGYNEGYEEAKSMYVEELEKLKNRLNNFLLD